MSLTQTKDQALEAPADKSQPTKRAPAKAAHPYPFEALAKLTPQDRQKRIDRDVVLTAFTLQEGDVIGNVAYSIYKQHKHDWLEAFKAARGREPDENETASYILGETTGRRVSAYRFLASATLAGEGLELSATQGSLGFAERRFAAVSKQVKTERERTRLINLLGFGVVIVLSILLALRFGFAG